VDEIADLINSTLYKLRFLKWVSLRSERLDLRLGVFFFDKKAVENWQIAYLTKTGVQKFWGGGPFIFGRIGCQRSADGHREGSLGG
jgi:hypothetical protein